MAAPGFCAHAPLGVARHHATLAQGHARLVQNVVHARGHGGEPGILIGAIRLHDDGIVLVERQQAFATTARTQDQHRIRHRRGTVARDFQAFLADQGRTAGQCRQFAGDDRGDVASVDAFFMQRRRDRGKFRPS